MLTFSSYDANALLASIGWEKLQTQRKIQKAVMVHISQITSWACSRLFAAHMREP
jgi:hypothetical protein